MSIKNPSNEKWFVEKYSTTDDGIGWLNIGDLNDGEQKTLIYFLLSNIGDMRRDNTKRIASLGGRPYWVQNPEIPTCPECSKMMFYVGQNQTSKWSSCIGDQVVFGFLCENCNIAIQIVQFT